MSSRSYPQTIYVNQRIVNYFMLFYQAAFGMINFSAYFCCCYNYSDNLNIVFLGFIGFLSRFPSQKYTFPACFCRKYTW